MWLHEAGEGNALYNLAKKDLKIPMSDTLQYMGGTSFNVDGSKADLGIFLVGGCCAQQARRQQQQQQQRQHQLQLQQQWQQQLQQN
jgi:hypothetical protein